MSVSAHSGHIRWALLFALAALSVWHIDLAAAEDYGQFVSFALFVVVLGISLHRLDNGIACLFGYVLTTPDFPRDVLLKYDDLAIGTGHYYTLSTVVVGLPLTYILLLCIALQCAWRIRNEPFKRWLIFLPAAFLLLGLSSLLLALAVDGAMPTMKALRADMRFPIAFAAAAIVGLYLARSGRAMQLIVSLLWCLPLFLGLRLLMFVGWDFSQGEIKFELATQPFISAGVLAALMLWGPIRPYHHWACRILLYASLFSTSRTHIALVVAVLLLTVVATIFNRRGYFKPLLEASIVIFSLGLSIYAFNPALFEFIAWKAEVITRLLDPEGSSGSGQVRMREIQNVFHEISQSSHELLIGKGWGGTYSFREYPLELTEKLDRKSFSVEQLDAWEFTSAHTFLSKIPLNYGLLGLAMYIALPLTAVVRLCRSTNWSLFSRTFLGISLLLMIETYFGRLDLNLTTIAVSFAILGHIGIERRTLSHAQVDQRNNRCEERASKGD